MSQTRLYATGDEATINQLNLQLEADLEELGLPVSMFETEPDSPVWAISVYVDDDQKDNIASLMKAIIDNAGIATIVEEEALGDVNWVAQTLEALAPVEAGRFIVHGSHDSDRPKPHQHDILVDAGLAFGTGHHGTTAGCLEMLSTIFKARNFINALDVGTGSGVLAIAIAKALKVPVLASDIDPVATLTAKDNCRKNGVTSHVKCVTATGFNHREISGRKPFDLIVANILARPLEKLAQDMSAHAAANSTILLSGLLPHQKARIVAAYRQQGFFLEHAIIRDGWLVLAMRSSIRSR